MEENKILMNKVQSDELIKLIKKYVNLFKGLHTVDPALAAEFKKKQDFYFNQKHTNGNSSCCGESKINHKSNIFLI